MKNMRDYTIMTDKELIERSSRLDDRAFETLYDRYEKTVYSLVYFKLKSPDDAADATQETFFKLWQKASLYSGKGSVGAFICTIASNTATDILRKREESLSLTATDKDGDEAELTLTDGDRTPEQETLHVEELELVKQAIEELPEQQREVLVLCVINEMSYLDAAQALGADAARAFELLREQTPVCAESEDFILADAEQTDAILSRLNEIGVEHEVTWDEFSNSDAPEIVAVCIK